MKTRTSISRSKVKKQAKSILLRLMKVPYKIELTPLSKEDGGGYLASISLLHGCQSDGRTPDEAIKNLQEAQEAWLASALKNGDQIPLPQMN